MFRITMVPPASDRTAEREFAAGLSGCYRYFGVGDAVSVLAEAQRPAVTHVVVRDDDDIVVGGARIHRAGRGSPLPSLRALADRPALRAAVIGDASRSGPPLELASLWVCRTRRECRGLGRLVAQASVAVAAVGRASRAITFSHHTIEPLLRGIGMRPAAGMQTIAYPSPAYRSTIYEIEPLHPDHASDGDRRQITAIADAWAEAPSELPVVPVNETPEGLRWTVLPSKRAIAA